MPQGGPKMAPTWPNMVKDIYLELFWAFVLGCLRALWLYLRFAFVLLSFCLRFALALLSLCPALPMLCLPFSFSFPFPFEWGGSSKLYMCEFLFYLGYIWQQAGLQECECAEFC